MTLIHSKNIDAVSRARRAPRPVASTGPGTDLRRIASAVQWALTRGRLPCGLAIAAAAFSSPAGAQSVDTSSVWNGATFIDSWGLPDTATYGQTITATNKQNQLSNFGFQLNAQGGGTPQYQAFVYQWDGGSNRITGSALYTSGVMTAPGGSAFVPVSFDVGKLSLTPNQQYVLFLTTSSVAQGGSSSYNWGSVVNTAYTGGQFVYQNNGAVFANLSSVAWSTIAQDLVFIATFIPVGEFVPVSNDITHGVATVLDQLVADPAIGAEMAAALDTLSGLSDEERAVAMNRLTPLANNALAKLGAGALEAGLSTVTGRLEGLRNAGALAWAPVEEKTTLAAVGPTGGLLEQNELRHGLWGKLFAANANQDAMDGFAGYEATTQGLTLGADTRLEQGTVVGGAFTYATTNIDQEDFMRGSGNDLQSYQATAYASHDFGAWYMEGMLAYARQNYESHRDTQVSGVAKADFDGDLYAARVVAGYPRALGEKLVVTPFASLEYSHMTQDGYEESGAGPLDLRVGRTTADRIRSGLGVRLIGEYEVSGKRLRPSVHVQWLHDFRNDGIATTANFIGGGAAFTTPGQEIAADSANVGLGLLFAVAKNAAVSVHYDFEGSDGFQSHTGQLVAQFWF
jgi:outer membrane autotransporter protein